jgi:murein DD-endopeptidase MepM/ murein hydrolase activator NlpD
VRRIAIVIGLIGISAVGLVLVATHAPARAARSQCGFDFPVGPPDGTGYYDAQPFGRNDHLGNDWNGLRGGDTDLGFPVFAVADGIVLDASDHGGGWGNVVRITHTCGETVESLSAHLDRMYVVTGVRVQRGQMIGTIGTANGQYRAHLHFELRDRPLPIGDGYSTDRRGFLDPAEYIRRHRR